MPAIVSNKRLLVSQLFFTIIIHWTLKEVSARIKFTNMKCISLDKSFADFRRCDLKMLQRNLVSLNAHAELYQLPVTKVSVAVALLKKTNGYNPFMYNYTADFCAVMANRNRNVFLKMFFDMLTTDSNINHTCPYNHDIIIQNFVFKEDYLRLIALLTGEYMFHVKVGAYNKWRAELKVYIEVVEN